MKKNNQNKENLSDERAFKTVINKKVNNVKQIFEK